MNWYDNGHDLCAGRQNKSLILKKVESLKCHFLRFGGEILCMNEEKMLGILMKQDQVVGKTKLISGKQDDCPTFK